jgi:hypothetical protein
MLSSRSSWQVGPFLERLLQKARDYKLCWLVLDSNRKRSSHAIASGAPLMIEDVKGASIKVNKSHVLFSVERLAKGRWVQQKLQCNDRTRSCMPVACSNKFTLAYELFILAAHA